MSKLVSNYLYSVLYQILIMIMPFITTPYISRVLQPEGVGVDAYVTSVVRLFLVFSMLSILLYGSRQIAIKVNTQDTSKEFLSIYTVQLLFTILNFALYLVFIIFIANYKVYYLIHIVSFVATALDVTWFFYGKEQIKWVALRNIIVRIFSIVLVFVLVKTPADLTTYIVINVLTLLIGHLVMWLPLLKVITFQRIYFSDIRRHLKPIFMLFIPQVMVQVYTLINIIILGNISGDVQVGYYNQAYKILNLCLGVITALGTVLLPRISSEYSRGNIENIKKYSKTTLKFVFLITIPMIIGLIAIAPNFVTWFFGKSYDEVTLLIIIMSPGVLFVGMATVFGIQILVSTNQQKKYTISVTVGAICSLVINLLLVSSYGSKATSIALLIAEGVGAIIQMYYTRMYFNLRVMLKDFLKYFFLGITMYIAIVSCSLSINTTPILLTFIQIFIGISTYFVGLIIIKDSLVYRTLSLLKNIVKRRGHIR